MIRVLLPMHLRTLAGVDDEVRLDVPSPVTQCAVLDALESRYPACFAARFGTMSLVSGGRLCVSLPAGGTFRTNRPMRRCPTRLPRHRAVYGGGSDCGRVAVLLASSSGRVGLPATARSRQK